MIELPHRLEPSEESERNIEKIQVNFDELLNILERLMLAIKDIEQRLEEGGL